MNPQGLLLCAKYSASPNFFGFCGPDESRNIIDHLKEEIADRELAHFLSEFETLYPYLKLISHENKIKDPFDGRVVAAYWIGNSLLNNVKNLNYLYFLTEKLDLEKKTDKENFHKIKRKILTHGFLPHHTFHVFNILKRTGKDKSFHTLSTMDSCRISWGKIIKNISVETKQLITENQKLMLSRPVIKDLKIDYKGRSFIKNLKAGDWVSFHWGYICDILTDPQVRSLEFYTQKAINYYNLL